LEEGCSKMEFAKSCWGNCFFVEFTSEDHDWNGRGCKKTPVGTKGGPDPKGAKKVKCQLTHDLFGEFKTPQKKVMAFVTANYSRGIMTPRWSFGGKNGEEKRARNAQTLSK